MQSRTAYHARRFGVALAAALALIISTVTGASAASLTWAGGASGLWTSGSNWSNGAVPGTNDLVAINTSAIITNVPNISLSRLYIGTGAIVSLRASAARTVTISNGAGVDFDVAPSAVFNDDGTGSGALTIALASGATGTVEGTINVTTAAHRILSATAGGLTFNTGSVISLVVCHDWVDG